MGDFHSQLGTNRATAILIVGALLAAFVVTGWRTVSDVTRDEEVKQRLRWIDRDTMKLEDRINDLDQRVKALEARP